MKKLLLAFICLQSVFIFGQVPDIQWQKSLGGTSSDIGTSMQQTTDGGYIMAGYSSSTNGDVTGNHGGQDYWIVKLDANRNIAWQKSYGGTGQDHANHIEQTTDGGYIVAGYSNSTNGDITGNNGSYDCWIIKLDANGNLIWQKSLGGSVSDVASSIQQTTDGGYIMAGYSYSNDGDVTGNNGDTDYWIVKLDVNGNISWQKNYGGTFSDWARSIQQTSDGGYIVAGESASPNGDVTGSHGGRDGWIVKLNATGNIVWQKTYGGTGNEIFYSIQQTVDGGYVVVGSSNSADGDVTENKGATDSWIVKLDANGNISWQKTYGGTGSEIFRSIQQTLDGNYIVSGHSNSADGDVLLNNGVHDAWILRLDLNGNIIWQKTCGGTGEEIIFSVHQTTHGDYILGGYSNSTNGDVIGNNGSHDYWIVKLGDCSPVSNTITETACSSFTWTNGDGQTYTSSTTVTYTIPNGAVNGCDSTITLNLTINQPTSSVLNETSCGSYTLNSQTYTASGTYTQTLVNVNNCDSTITLNLTINNVDATVSLSGITLTANQTAATYQWIDCDNGNISVSGETNQSFEPTANGNYAVEVTANGCTETSNCIAVNSVGITSLEQNGWSIYPNPGKGIFTVKGESLNNDMAVKVMNTLGQTIKRQITVSNGTIMIDLTNEPTGMYLLEIDNIIVKLIKE